MITDEEIGRQALVGEVILVLRMGGRCEKCSLLRAIAQLAGDDVAQNGRAEWCPEIGEFEWQEECP